MSMPLLMFLVFIAITLAITAWAARRSSGASAYFAAGRRITGWQRYCCARRLHVRRQPVMLSRPAAK